MIKGSFSKPTSRVRASLIVALGVARRVQELGDGYDTR